MCLLDQMPGNATNPDSLELNVWLGLYWPHSQLVFWLLISLDFCFFICFQGFSLHSHQCRHAFKKDFKDILSVNLGVLGRLSLALLFVILLEVDVVIIVLQYLSSCRLYVLQDSYSNFLYPLKTFYELKVVICFLLSFYSILQHNTCLSPHFAPLLLNHVLFFSLCPYRGKSLLVKF